MMSIRSKLPPLCFVILFSIGCQQTAEPTSEPIEEVIVNLLERGIEEDEIVVESLNVSREKILNLFKVVVVSDDWPKSVPDPPTLAPPLPPYDFELIFDSSGPSPISISGWESCDVVSIHGGENVRFREISSPEGIELLSEIYNSALEKRIKKKETEGK